MVWDAPIPDADPDSATSRSGQSTCPKMLDLVAHPLAGTFSPCARASSGDYFACSTARASWRWRASAWKPGRGARVSGVCTHPDVAGRGLAWRLIANDRPREIARGQLPFLHVMPTTCMRSASTSAWAFVRIRRCRCAWCRVLLNALNARDVGPEFRNVFLQCNEMRLEFRRQVPTGLSRGCDNL
jgi:hypothetical protein